MYNFVRKHAYIQGVPQEVRKTSENFEKIIRFRKKNRAGRLYERDRNNGRSIETAVRQSGVRRLIHRNVFFDQPFWLVQSGTSYTTAYETNSFFDVNRRDRFTVNIGIVKRY